MDTLWIGWTTVEDEESAKQLAREAVEQGLAACVQVEGPLTSYYVWEEKVTEEAEFRLTFKFVAARRVDLESWLKDVHPYDVPEWLAVKADSVNAAYRRWVADGTEEPSDF